MGDDLADLGPVPPPPGQRQHYDWEPVRQTFVEGHLTAGEPLRWLNLREVAELHGVPYGRIRQQAMRYNWTEARAAFQTQLNEVRRAERAQVASDAIRKLDDQALVAAQTGMALVTERLGQILRQVTDASQKVGGEDLDVYVEPLDGRELATLARAAADWRELGAISLGYPTSRVGVEVGPAGDAPVPLDLREKLSFDDTDDSRLLGTLAALEAAGFAVDRGPETGDPAGGHPALPSG